MDSAARARSTGSVQTKGALLEVHDEMLHARRHIPFSDQEGSIVSLTRFSAAAAGCALALLAPSAQAQIYNLTYLGYAQATHAFTTNLAYQSGAGLRSYCRVITDGQTCSNLVYQQNVLSLNWNDYTVNDLWYSVAQVSANAAMIRAGVSAIAVWLG